MNQTSKSISAKKGRELSPCDIPPKVKALAQQIRRSTNNKKLLSILIESSIKDGYNSR